MPLAVQAGLANHVHWPWTRNANIYEVNLRQYTKEGTFNAFAAHLPALKKLGVDILWLMPIHPIGERNRKGGMGSYYSVRDYKAVAAEYGSIGDFCQLVKQAHGLGMRVLETGNDKVFAFQRQAGANLVTVAVNLSEQSQNVVLPGRDSALKLAAWDWHIGGVNK